MNLLYNLLLFASVISTIHCTDFKNVSKCCGRNQVVGQLNRVPKLCFDSPESEYLDWSLFKIYDNYGEITDKTINNTFNIVENKFNTDEEFHAFARNTITLSGFVPHLIENSMLYLEMPNAYYRWTKVENEYFCIDFYRNKDGVTKPGFWTYQKTQELLEDKNDDFLTAAMLVSCSFLLVVLIVYAVLPELRNLCGLILIAYVISLFFALLCLAIIRMKTHGNNVCYGLTIVIYFFFLASFCWMNVMSYDIWWTFRGYAKARPIHRRGEPFKYMMYSLYAWGLPLAMTIMLTWINETNLTDKPWFIKPNLLHGGCFIEDGEKFLYLYIPMLILICTNWLFYLMTAFNIWRLSRGTAVLDSAAAGAPAAHRSNKQRFLVYLKLTIVMGLNWILEVVSFLVPDFQVWYITDFYNILIGVSIFLIFVCKRQILKKLIKLYLHRKGQWHPNTSTRSHTTSSETNQETQTLQVCANPKGPGSVVNNF